MNPPTVSRSPAPDATGADLLRAVALHPEEDVPRLMYADHLDEVGGAANAARAEFIRVQIELARIGPEPHRHARACHRHGRYRTKYKTKFTDCEACAKCRSRWLRLREEELLADVGYRAVNVPRVWPVSMTVGRCDAGDGTGKLCFRRGFVEWWRMRAADWLEHGDEVLSAHPLTRVKLTTRPDVEVDPVLGRGAEIVASLLGRDSWHTFPRLPTEGLAAALLKLDWPRVAFEVPQR